MLGIIYNDIIYYSDVYIYVYIPIGSMHGLLTYTWMIFMVNVGKYTSPMDLMGYI